jgi:YbgC/YbaW family acyl-CoA thioester hydrolase
MPDEYHTKRKIEFSDTDLAGIVHFSRFFVFMETAEHQFLQSLGTSVSTVYKGDKIGWPRLVASCEYFHPAEFEDELDIHLKIFRKGNKSLTYQFCFIRSGLLLAQGKLSTVCCVCNPNEQMKSIPIPNFIADQIEEVDIAHE